MVLKARKHLYPDISFPHTQIAMTANIPGKISPAIKETAMTQTCKGYHVHDFVLSNGHIVQDLPKNFCIIANAIGKTIIANAITTIIASTVLLSLHPHHCPCKYHPPSLHLPLPHCC